MSTTTIHIQATEAQLQRFEHQCEVTELMLASTLCRRYQIPTTQENLGIVAGWMSTARSMGIANHLTSGIQMQMVNDQAKPEGLGEIRQQALDLCHLIEQAGASPELTAASGAASELLKSINALMP